MLWESLPPWLARSLAVGAARIPMHDVVRSALTLPLVLGTAYAAAGPAVAVYASLAALMVVLGEREGTTGQRLLKSGAALLAGTAAMALGPLTSGTGLIPLAVVMAFAVVSGLMSAMGHALSFAGMQMLVQMSIAGGLSVALPTEVKLIAYVAGGSVALLGIWLQSAMEHTERRYPDALLAVLERLAASCRCSVHADLSCPHEGAEIARRDIDRLLGEASDLVLTARPLRPGRRRAHAALRAMRDEISVMVTTAWTGSAVPVRLLQRIECLKEALRRWPAVGHPVGAQSTRPSPVGLLVRRALRSADTWIFVLRLTLCMAMAEALRQWTPLGHAYWLPLTVALALKPDLGSVFTRSLQRGMGTAIGILIGWGAMWIVPGPVALLILGALSAAIPYTVRRNYAWFAVIATPIVLVLLDFVTPVSTVVMEQRLVHTAVGCGIVLLFGHALWPLHRFPSVETVASSIRTDIDAFRQTVHTEGGARLDPRLADRRLEISRAIAALRKRSALASDAPRWIQASAKDSGDTASELEDRLLATLRGRSDSPALAAVGEADAGRLSRPHGHCAARPAAERRIHA